MTTDEAQRTAKKLLADLYETREAATIADWLMEKITGLAKIDRIIYKNDPLTEQQQNNFAHFTTELVRGRPIQYVIGEADFMGLRLFVDENVLIPRPETEELVQWMLETTNKEKQLDTSSENEPVVLDIGTGSGCIPISFKLKNPLAKITACDISEGAIQVAKRNSHENNADVNFVLTDILDRNSWTSLPVCNLIVSNPPYIPEKDKKDMRVNVLSYEPHLALFTSDDDPYIFYRAITAFASEHLLNGGHLFFEIHESGADEVVAILGKNRFKSIETRKDIFEKPRMIRATWQG